MRWFPLFFWWLSVFWDGSKPGDFPLQERPFRFLNFVERAVELTLYFFRQVANGCHRDAVDTGRGVVLA